MTEAEWLASRDGKAMLSFLMDGTESWRFAWGLTERKIRSLLNVFSNTRGCVFVPYIDESLTRNIREGDHELLREVLGNPFRPFIREVDYYKDAARRARVFAHHKQFEQHSFGSHVIRHSWLTWNDGCVVNMAKAIDHRRAFDELPFLADALEESGATIPDIINHLRGPGPHYRGCWVLDLLLGRS